jgi:hypothetical protein
MVFALTSVRATLNNGVMLNRCDTLNGDSLLANCKKDTFKWDDSLLNQCATHLMGEMVFVKSVCDIELNGNSLWSNQCATH